MNSVKFLFSVGDYPDTIPAFEGDGTFFQVEYPFRWKFHLGVSPQKTATSGRKMETGDQCDRRLIIRSFAQD
jgi:hypothetical protein